MVLPLLDGSRIGPTVLLRAMEGAPEVTAEERAAYQTSFAQDLENGRRTTSIG